jgi:hypothetical protein
METSSHLMLIKTASWFVKLPADHVQVGVSRRVPRGMPTGYKRCRSLEPGSWFHSVSIREYLERYGAILAALDPRRVVDELIAIGGGRVPVMLCYESAVGVREGKLWCHRHLAAQWLEDRLGIKVEEFGHPNLDRFTKLRLNGIKPPNYK